MPYWPCTVKICVRCQTRDPKEQFLKFWAWSFQLLQRSCLYNIFLAAPYGPCPTDRVRSKLVSDAKLGTLRNSSWNFELNPSSHYRAVVCPFFWAASYWPCPTDRVRSKFLSDAKLGTLRNISWNFESNPSSQYRGIV